MPRNSLQVLIAASVANPALEPAFLAALLKERLFVHVPLSDDSGRIRLVQFMRPDGLSVIPVFSDFDRANLAAQGSVRVATVLGRELLEGTRGATLMLDPNDTSCTLYPEEIAALLDEGTALPAPGKASPGERELGPAGSEHEWLGEIAAAAVKHIDQVHALWLAKHVDVTPGFPPILVIVLGVAPAYEERAIRALGLALSSRLPGIGVTVDATTVDLNGEAQPWPVAAGLQPYWSRINVA